MKRLLAVTFLVFVLSVVSLGRQIYDFEITCLDTDDECLDDGHVFKDSEIPTDQEDLDYQDLIDPDYEYVTIPYLPWEI